MKDKESTHTYDDHTHYIHLSFPFLFSTVVEDISFLSHNIFFMKTSQRLFTDFANNMLVRSGLEKRVFEKR